MEPQDKIKSSLPDKLDELEAIIDRGRNSFYEVGLALLRIRDDRLYKEEYTTFEEYCLKKWNFTPQRGYSLMQAASVASLLDEIPEKAAYAEKLTILEDPDTIRSAWEEVLGSGKKITARLVENIAKKHFVIRFGGTLAERVIDQDITPAKAYDLIKCLGSLPDYYSVVLTNGIGKSDCVESKVLLALRRYEYDFKNDVFDILRSGYIDSVPLWESSQIHVEFYFRRLLHSERAESMVLAAMNQADRLSNDRLLVANSFDVATLDQINPEIAVIFPEGDLDVFQISNILKGSGYENLMLVAYRKKPDPVLKFDGYTVKASKIRGNKPLLFEEFIIKLSESLG